MKLGMDMNSRTKRTSRKCTTIKGYLLMHFSTDNGMYQVITFLEIHSNIGYSSFIFNFLYLYYIKNHILCNYLTLYQLKNM